MLNKVSVDDINVKGQRVLVRCDFNVPLQDGKITDENRLVASLPTIKKLIADGGKVILCSHLGKPKGEAKPELSLAPVAQYVKTAAVGYLMQKEIDFLGNAVNNPARPFVAILGGSKVSSKISVINNLLDKVDTLIIGGGMAYTFMKAQGGKIGTSLCEDDYLDYANDMIKKAADKGVKMLIPVDTVIADAFSNDANVKVVDCMERTDGCIRNAELCCRYCCSCSGTG